MKKIRNMKLFPKTFLYLLALFGVIILITHLSIYFFLPKVYRDNIDRELEDDLDILCAAAAAVDWADCDLIFQRYATDNGVNLEIKSEGETLVYQGMQLHFMLYQRMDEAEQFRITGVDGMESIIIKRRAVASRDGREMDLKMSANTQPVREAVRLTLILLPITSAVAVVMSVIFAFLYSHKLTRPIGQMLSVTREMEELERDAAVPIESGDELGMLAERINQLYRRLWQTIQSLEQEKAHISRMERNKLDFLRSASHELKTPLAGLRILLENMKYNVGRYKDHETYLQEAMDMVDRLSLMLRDILDASRNQAESGSKERLKIPEELAAVWQDYELMARAEGLSVDIQIEPGLEVEMDRTQFRRLWSNLFSNAVRYTENGGHISIRGGAGELSVWNSCTPIPPEQAERLFEAFYRPDFARSSADGGSGLGLYLVKGILDANRLPCSFVPDGEGMRFTMGLAPN